jgi:hypothetical protein
MSGFALTRIKPQLFDERTPFLATLRPENFARFKAGSASRLLGWDNPPGRTVKQRNCAQADITYTFDEDHLRVHNDRPARNATVLIAGDSYTEGEEVEDSETFPAVVERTLGVAVANLGVGGYGPDQALLKLEALADRFPQARVAVLAIIYDDLRRMLNSYRPVLSGNTGIKFGLKPYMRDGQFQEIPGGDPFLDFASFLAAANLAFDEDYWRRPRARPPYSAAVIDAALSPTNWIPTIHQNLMQGQSQNELFFTLEPVRSGLRAIYDRLIRLAQSRNLAPVVVFIPTDVSDQRSGELAIAAATGSHWQAITFRNVGRDFDWSRYRGPTCHPNVDGYRMIGLDVAKLVKPLLQSTAGRPSELR